MVIAKKFGQNLKRLRQNKNISQEKFASLAKLHRTYISDIERGKKNLSLKNVEKIAQALNIDIRELFTF